MALGNDLRQLIEYDIFRVKRILHRLVDELPDSFEARLLLGDAYLRSLDIEQAIPHYQAALRIDPKSRVAVTNLALCGIYTGRYEAALLGFERLLAGRTDHFAALLSGVLLHRLGRVTEAIGRLAAMTGTAKPDSALLPVGLAAEVRARRDAADIAGAEAVSAWLMAVLDTAPGEAASELHRRFSSYDFHEWSALADKAHLARLMAREAGGDLRVPTGFVLPEQRATLAQWGTEQPPGAVFVVKPRGGQGGQGIRLTDDIMTCLDAEDVVVQRYIDPPFLVQGRKAHLRIYCLITSVDPLRFYVHDNGIVRFAPEEYRRGPGWLERADMHVTNTALHRKHRKLVVSQDPAVENQGHVWSLHAYLQEVGKAGHNPKAVFRAIARLVGRFVLAVRGTGLFARQIAAGRPRSFGHKLFGLDVLLDAEARPWLIEIQRSPAWAGQPLARRINGEVAQSMARMTVGPLLRPGEDPAVLADPAALARREAEMEQAHCGGFVRVLHTRGERRPAGPAIVL